MKCIFKIFTLGLLVISLFVTTAMASESLEDYETRDPILKQVETISEFSQMNALSRTSSNSVDLLFDIEPGTLIDFGVPENASIVVGIPNINDEEFKNTILSLPGVSKEDVYFVEFIIIPPEEWVISWEDAYLRARDDIENGRYVPDTVLEAFFPDLLPSDHWDQFEFEGLTSFNFEDEDMSLGARNIGFPIQPGMVTVINGHAATVGAPTADLNAFTTANHGVLRIGHIAQMWMNNFMFTIGAVDNHAFTSTHDLTRVNVSSRGNRTSRTTRSGTFINNLRAHAPNPGTPVVMHGGFSGPLHAQILHPNMQSGHMFTLVGVWGFSRNPVVGDSGAVLLHGSNSIGHLSFGGFWNGNFVAFFSNTWGMPWS